VGPDPAFRLNVDARSFSLRDVNSDFQLSLEYIGPGVDCYIFRVAFESSTDRYLLNYPEVTGLKFRPVNGIESTEFTTRFLVSAPQDEFVLNPNDRIAFDLRAYINRPCTLERRWTVDLSPGDYEASYLYSIDPNRRRYDYLNKGSRFAAMTKPWSGLAISSVVPFRIASVPPPEQVLR